MVPDGVFGDDGEGGLGFHPLPPPTDEEVDRVTGAIAKAVLKLLSGWEREVEDDELRALCAPGKAVPVRSAALDAPPQPGRRRAQVKTELGTSPLTDRHL